MASLYDDLPARLERDPRLTKRGGARPDLGLAVPSGDVVIGTNAILMNHRYDVVHDRGVRFGGARVLETGRPAILEVRIMVPGKYRRVAEEYRIPIPAGHEDEARAVARELAGAHA
jgi:hypothetical protein